MNVVVGIAVDEEEAVLADVFDVLGRGDIAGEVVIGARIDSHVAFGVD